MLLQNKKENIILWISLSFIVLICANIFNTYFLNLIFLKSTLTNLSIILIILDIIMIIKIKKDIICYENIKT